MGYILPRIGQPSEIIRTSSMISTDIGILTKWRYKDRFYKTGELSKGIFNPKQCYAEYLACHIGHLLGFDIVMYNLQYVHTRGFDYLEGSLNYHVDSQDIVTCYSENFAKEDEIFVSIEQLYSKKLPTYEEFINDYPECQLSLNSMLIFDCLINNVDRHFNNFQLLRNINNELRLTPIYDNGLSLLINETPNSLKRIVEESNYIKRCDKAKPFVSKHSKQIKLLYRDNAILPDINFSNEERLYEMVDRFILFTEVHRDAIKVLLRDRLNMIKELYKYHGKI